MTGHKSSSVPADEVFGEAIRSMKTPPPSVKFSNWPMLTKLTGGFRPYEFTILCGATGCLAGDTRIRLHRNGKGYESTLFEIYKQWNNLAANKKWDLNEPTYVRSYNGFNINLHKVKNVYLSGIKETWRINFSSGQYLRCTPDHKILTDKGWIMAKDLSVGNKIALDMMMPRKTNRSKSKVWDSYFCGARYHPYATTTNGQLKRIVKHRAIYEAKGNGLSLDEYLDIIRNNEKVAKELEYVNPKLFHIHHKDEDHYNNDPSNLELLSIRHHAIIHGKAEHFHAGSIRYTRFVGFNQIGVEPVYDIECEDPHHNFVANGIVVHNSGKTTLCANISWQLMQQGISQYVASVETGKTDYVMRIISAAKGIDWNTGDPVEENELRDFCTGFYHHFEKSKFWISLFDDRVKIETLLSEIDYQIRKNGTQVAIVDNMNFFMEVTKSDNAIVEMDRVVHQAIIFCKQNPVHLIMIMHPRKTENGRVMSEFDIKGSSISVQEAHNVWLFNRPSYELIKNNEANVTDRELTIAKQRRLGKYVGHKLLFSEVGGVRYNESKTFAPDSTAFRNAANPSTSSQRGKKYFPGRDD